MSEAAAAPAEGASKGQGKGKMIIMIVAALVVAGGGAGAGVFFMNSSHPKKEEVKAEPVAPPTYVALDPPFVVNFESEQLVRFLQVTVQVMTRDPATVELLKANDPVVRNDLLLLLGGQKYTVISTREGKEALRQQALTAVRKVISGAGGKPDKVEAIYFTSFVMQ